MKEYQITLQVPDDFDPEQLELGYPEDFEIVTEGEFSPLDYVEQVGKVEPDSVIIFRFPPGIDPEFANWLQHHLESQFPDNKVVGIVGDLEIMIQNEAEAVKVLESMIEKVKSGAARAKILAP